MADNTMKLKIEYDSINKAEKPVQSLVNFFTNNSTLRMLKRENNEAIEITDSEQFLVTVDGDHWEISEDESKVLLFLGEGYDGFNGKCKLLSITVNPTVESDEGQWVYLESVDISLNSEDFEDLAINYGSFKINSENLLATISDSGAALTDVSKFEVKLTHKIETKWTANIINDCQLDSGQIGIASIKYEDKSEEPVDSTLVQAQGVNTVIDCNTKFVKVNTALKFYTIGSEAEAEASEGTEFSTVKAELIEDMKGIPVTITPYYNGKENTDEDIIPNFAKDNPDTDEDDKVIQNHKMQLDKDLAVDWKLRTTTFTLQSESTSYDVFYKVGFFPADGKEATEKDVIESLKLYALRIERDGHNCALEYPEWAKYQFSHLNHNNHYNLQMPITLKPMWFPVCTYDQNNNNNKTFEGIMYIELYNSNDGSKFTEDIEDYYAIVNSDNDDNDNNHYDYFHAPLKDYMIDKGNIPSVVRYSVPS
jgi:hypothetical protein